jgi:hypothetical protein
MSAASKSQERSTRAEMAVWQARTAEFGDPDVDLQHHCMKAISQKPAQK